MSYARSGDDGCYIYGTGREFVCAACRVQNKWFRYETFDIDLKPTGKYSYWYEDFKTPYRWRMLFHAIRHRFSKRHFTKRVLKPSVRELSESLGVDVDRPTKPIGFDVIWRLFKESLGDLRL